MRRLYSCMLLILLLLAATPAGAAVWTGVSPRVFTQYTSAEGLADNSAQTIHCTKTGRLVITTVGQINFYDGAKFSYIDPTDENIYALPEYRGNYHLYFDRYHHIWLKNTHSVTCVDLITERFAASIDDEFHKFGMSDRVLDMFVDSTGVAWLLSASGLYNVETKKVLKPRPRLNLQDLEVYKDKYVMLFYENGLVERYEIATGKKVAESRAYGDTDGQRYGASSLVSKYHQKVYQIRNGSKEAILMNYDVERNQWNEILRAPYHLNNMAFRDSMMYVACEYGYWVINLNTMVPAHVEGMRLFSGEELHTDVNVIAFDRQGGMWVGTERRGLLYSRPFKVPFHLYKWGDPTADRYGTMMNNVPAYRQFRNRTVNCVYKDSRGWTWVGTTQGLQLYRRESDMLPQVFTKKEGLYNNIIHSIIEDANRNIWVATSYGISVLLLNEEGRVTFVNSYNQYDLVPNEVFENGKAMRLADGTIVMQGLDHVVDFNPSTMSTLDNRFDFKIYPKLIQLLVNGVDVTTTTELDGKRVLDRALSRVWALDLNYNQNSITMVFSALNYFRPQQTYYRVRMKGLDDEWRILSPYSDDGMVDENGLLHLPLMGIQPGEYELEVQASMSLNDWETKPYVWKITIHEPWWRTTGVFALFGLVLAVLLLINIYYYMKNATLKAMRNSEETMLIKRIYNFVERIDSKEDVLEPSPEEYTQATLDTQLDLDPEFIKAIDKIAPVVEMERKQKKMTMRRLSNAAGVGVKEFYAMITANIFKSPRVLVKRNRLAQAERMLRNTKAPIDEVAKECGFVSANYFIASFYQKYKTTPQQYRQKR